VTWLVGVALAVLVACAVEVAARRRRAQVAAYLAALEQSERAAEKRVERRRLASMRAPRRPRHSRPPYPVVR
jgi:hypothetical protein